jgi:hypothetical protein
MIIRSGQPACQGLGGRRPPISPSDDLGDAFRSHLRGVLATLHHRAVIASRELFRFPVCRCRYRPDPARIETSGSTHRGPPLDCRNSTQCGHLPGAQFLLCVRQRYEGCPEYESFSGRLGMTPAMRRSLTHGRTTGPHSPFENSFACISAAFNSNGIRSHGASRQP